MADAYDSNEKYDTIRALRLFCDDFYAFCSLFLNYLSLLKGFLFAEDQAKRWHPLNPKNFIENLVKQLFDLMELK